MHQFKPDLPCTALCKYLLSFLVQLCFLMKPNGLFAQSRDCPYIFLTNQLAYLVMFNYYEGTKVVSTTQSLAEPLSVHTDNLSVYLQPIWAIQDGKLCGRHY